LSSITYIESLATENYKKEVNNLLESSAFPWFYNNATKWVDDPKEKSFQFVHTFIDQHKTVSQYTSLALSIFPLLEEKLGIKVKNISRVKANLLTQLDLTDNDLDYTYHVDSNDSKQMSLLYYVNDSDGDTYIKDNDTIKTFKPVAGNAILFNSNLVHRATPPKDSKVRIVINYVFEVRE